MISKLVRQVLRPVQRQEGVGGGRDAYQDEDDPSLPRTHARLPVPAHPPLDQLQAFLAEETRRVDGQAARTVQRPAAVTTVGWRAI